MKVTLLTMWADNFKRIADISLPNFKAYCERHGYDLKELKIDSERFHYQKHIFLKEFLLTDVEVVFYIDIDAIITNQSLPVESFLDDEHDFYTTKDINEINTGTFILKNTEWGKWFNGLILGESKYYNNEQNVINAFHNTPFVKNKFKILPHPSINSYPYEYYYPSYGYIGWEDGDKANTKPTHQQGNWEEGDFVMHVPGLELNQRAEILKNTKII